jgi:glucose uptake protein
MLLSMLCWGSWANTQKIDKQWRFELFYWDYMWGLLACAVVFGLTLGSNNLASPDSFLRNLSTASARSLLEAFVGGVIFNLGNLLLVAAISVAGMAVAFPIGAGLALVIGAVINYLISPKGNPLLLFGGIALICVAIMLDALAYRGLSGGAKASTKGNWIESGLRYCCRALLPICCQGIDGPKPPGALYRVFRLCLGGRCFQFSHELRIDATPG